MTKNNIVLIAICCCSVGALAIQALGCGETIAPPDADADVDGDGDGDSDGDGDGDSDSDSDSDGDSDGDGDGDADADVDADADSEIPGDIFAAPLGSGEDCTESSPCLLTTARDQARARSTTMDEDIVVHLMGGTYELEAPFELIQELDSGKNGHDIIYRAHESATGDSRPVLSGGARITGFTLHDDVRNIYRAALPAELETRQIYVDGVRARRARGPLNPVGFIETDGGYIAPNDSMASFRNHQDIEIVSLVHWKSFRCPVASITGTAIAMAEPCWSAAQFHEGFDMGLPAWVENAYEYLDIPGEFYLDRHEGALYYIPRFGEDLGTSEVIAPVLETVVSLTGTIDEPLHNVQLRGLTFAHATWLEPNETTGYAAMQAGFHLTEASWAGAVRTPGNVTLAFVQDTTIADCLFTHLGAYGLLAEGGVQRNLFQGNVFRDISSGGVQIADVSSPNTEDEREIAQDNTLRNNVITETGLEFHDSVGIFVGYAQRTTIEHNEIFNLPYTGISVGWGWGGADPSVARENRVAYNAVHHVMRRLRDGGHFYALSAQPDSVLEGNWFHSQINDFGSIYLDQGSQFWSATGNVIASTPYWYLLQCVVAPPAQNNVVQDNYTDTERTHCCGTLGCCTDPEKGNVIDGNTVYGVGTWPEETQAIIASAGLESSYIELAGAATRIEAEDYHGGGDGVGFHELTATNYGGVYRSDPVDLYPGPLMSNDVTLGWTETGEWLAYVIDARESGDYRFTFSTATVDDGCAIDITIDDVPVGTVPVPNTGDYQVFSLPDISDVALDEGPHLIRLVFTGGFNMDYFEYSL